ncbi:hypothetical protein ANCCAN_14907 [Ancylostoma caninum]|uniref:Uncharacterized protein n=1 Tax=Ancylostoma caninum TaxID=29170 RepID=A0A368G4A8_ANCCA|nr:hypothetical protein ANCCAN_14907 [Ancylostoma caninum]
MFVEILCEARSAISAEQLLTEKHKQIHEIEDFVLLENCLFCYAGKSLAGQGFGPPIEPISHSQLEVIENDRTSAKEVILAHLCAGVVKENEIVLKSDVKTRLSVLVTLNGVIQHLTAFATSEDGDYYRGRLLPKQWSEDRCIGDGDGVELKFGDLRVTNFGDTRDTRRLPFSLLDTTWRSPLSSACFNGLADMEEFRV